MTPILSSLLFIAILAAYPPAKAVTVQQIDSFISSGDKCLTHQVDRYIWVRGKDSEWSGRRFDERYRTALTLYQAQSKDGAGFKTVFNGPWDRALVPVLEAQRDAIFDALLTVDTTGSLLNGARYDRAGNIIALDALESYLRENKYRKLPNMVQTVARAFGAKTKKLEEILNSAPDADFNDRLKNTVLIAGACAQLSVLQVPSCVSATNAMLAEANYNANMILPKIWTDFVKSKALREGVRQSALLMLGRMKSQSPGHFFEDLSSGFQLAGFKPADASEAAWRLLALYGNGGPNTGYRLMAFDLPPEAEVLGVGLSFIGTAVTYLDFQQRMSARQHYALPSGLKGSCLTTKPYHFWLNAYFSRWLVKQGYSAEVAQSATFIVTKGYHVNRDVNNAGGGIEKLLSKPTDHPTNEVIRVDITLAAAGVVFGSQAEGHLVKPISVEEGLQRLQAVRNESVHPLSSSVLGQMVSDRIKLYKIWDDLYQPNEALRFFQMRQK